jgi:hypothetical protein
MGRRSVVVVAAVLLAACGGSDDGSSEDVSATTEATATAELSVETTEAEVTTTVVETTTTVAQVSVADAISIEPAVDARVGSATAFSPVSDPTPVATGDVVRTDSTGFAEIAYFDGSRTRLNVDTEFEVLELADDVAGSTVRTRLDVGRTWNRVETLGEGDEFSVETSVATAVVQGTAFSVQCLTPGRPRPRRRACGRD